MHTIQYLNPKEEGLIANCLIWPAILAYIVSILILGHSTNFINWSLIILTIVELIFGIYLPFIYSNQTHKWPLKYRIKVITNKKNETEYYPQYKNKYGYWLYIVNVKNNWYDTIYYIISSEEKQKIDDEIQKDRYIEISNHINKIKGNVNKGIRFIKV